MPKVYKKTAKMTKYTLLVKIDETINSSRLLKYYNTFTEIISEDSGLDLLNPNEVKLVNNKVSTINFEISCAMYNNETNTYSGYYLYPRSSFSKYPFIFANKVGIIDSGYRGNIMAKIRYIQEWNDKTLSEEIDISKIKLFQLCSPDLSPFEIKIVSDLPESTRGSDGFGSTGQ